MFLAIFCVKICIDDILSFIWIHVKKLNSPVDTKIVFTPDVILRVILGDWWPHGGAREICEIPVIFSLERSGLLCRRCSRLGVDLR